MIKRTMCLCNGEYIGIESIFNVINGKQINIPEKLLVLRAKSKAGELFCPCGCGANLILVASDKNLRKQHFKIKSGSNKSECYIVTEGKTSVDSKIVIKCWLNDKLKTDDIETRVPINRINNNNRKYEFSFFSNSKKIAISYCYDRVNLSDQKFDILEANSNGIRIIYIVDIMNGGCNGQYPEALMKVQDRQKYCLFLDVKDYRYEDSQMYATYYAKNNDELWEEVKIVSGKLLDYTIDNNGELLYKGELVSVLLEKKCIAYEETLRNERIWREEEKKRRFEEEQRLKLENEQREKERKEYREKIEQKRKEQQEVERQRREQQEIELRAEIKRREEDFKKNVAENFSQQERQVIDAYGNRWIRCEYCGKFDMTSSFSSYGGKNHINLGTCYECSKKVSSENALAINKNL